MSEQFQKNPILKLGPNPNGQFLYFFGARHTNNPKDEQFSYIKKFFKEFLSFAKGTKVMFVEGVTREIPQKYDEAINQYGESGAVKWLGRETSIDVIRSEPNDEEQRSLLCALFSPQLVAYSVIIQNLTGWFRYPNRTSFDEAVIRVLNREAKFSDIYGFLPDQTWFYEQHKKFFGEQKLEDKQFLDLISDPRKNDTVVNKVVTSRSDMRNKYILDKITNKWKAGKSIFIVYGRGHLDSLEESLKELVNEK